VRAGGALKTGLGFSQRHAARCVGFAAFLFVLATPAANAAGETRTLSLHNIHTHEDLTITYKKDGHFDDAALKRLNVFLRDWRKEQETKMDPQLFDMLWEVHREVKATGPIHVVCGFRSPATNEMLRNRSRSSGVAKTSLHMQGKAIDFSIPSADVAAVRAAALRIQGGGVGYYPTSGIPFVHMDVGNVRHWPRMTREQLAKVFPNGRTLHVSTDGPLPGYELALADAERGGHRRPATEPSQGRNLIASLFNSFRSQDPEEAADNTTSRQTASVRRPAPTATPATTPAAAAVAPPAPAVQQVVAQAVPLPPSRPAYQVAALAERPAPAPPPANANLASLSPNQIIEARGHWQGLPEMPRETTGANASGARRSAGLQTASADAELTASIGPFEHNDRVAPEVALAYAAEVERRSTLMSAAALIGAGMQRAATTVVTRQGAGSVALKPPVEITSAVRPVKAGERLNDPWLRGLVIAPSVQRSLVTTTFGVPDFRTLSPFMQKPAKAVMMTFSADPHLGMSYDEFTGSAVVFQATVTFGMQTAALR
jgi:uncharacterized protein YcbK (DUF882 family)